MNALPRILFVTSSLRTRWEVYSQALIGASGLAARRLVLDGRTRWHPLDFLEPALAVESDFIVHVDEDCFLLDPTQLTELLAALMADPDLVAAGVPDGGVPYRSFNRHACNLFFAVFKTAPLRELIGRNPEWRSLRFSADVARHLQERVPEATPERSEAEEYEPYYPLFWLILSQGKRILYLKSVLEPDLMASQVSVGEATLPMVLHAWHLRQWFSHEVDPFLGISPAEKYRRIQKRLNRLLIQRPAMFWHLARSAIRLICARLGRVPA